MVSPANNSGYAKNWLSTHAFGGVWDQMPCHLHIKTASWLATNVPHGYGLYWFFILSQTVHWNQVPSSKLHHNHPLNNQRHKTLWLQLAGCSANDHVTGPSFVQLRKRGSFHQPESCGCTKLPHSSRIFSAEQTPELHGNARYIELESFQSCNVSILKLQTVKDTILHSTSFETLAAWTSNQCWLMRWSNIFKCFYMVLPYKQVWYPQNVILLPMLDKDTFHAGGRARFLLHHWGRATVRTVWMDENNVAMDQRGTHNATMDPQNAGPVE